MQNDSRTAGAPPGSAPPGGYAWTKTKPTVRGFYWRRCNFDGHPTSHVIVHVFTRNGELWGENPFIACSFTKELSHKIWEHDEWAGPIPEPTHNGALCDPAHGDAGKPKTL